MISAFGMWTVLSMISVLVISSAQDVEEYRRIMCENLDNGIKEDTLECVGGLSEYIQSTMKDCAIKAFPTSEGNLEPIMVEGCKDKTILQEFDNCFLALLGEEESFKEEVKKSAEDVNVKECFDKVQDKYGVPMWFQ